MIWCSVLLLLFAAKNLEGKKLCKYYVQKELGLDLRGEEIINRDDVAIDASVKVPMVVCITRLVAQKGLHLIIHAIYRVKELVSLCIFVSPPSLCNSPSIWSHKSPGWYFIILLSINGSMTYSHPTHGKAWIPSSGKVSIHCFFCFKKYCL